MRIRTSLLAAGLCTALLGAGAAASAQVGISIRIAPPVLPVYAQPAMPAPGYLWVPGYWAWTNDGGYYYWVPGTWVTPPQTGLLWTPGYWGWDSGLYVWHEGYWGPHVGFYGGVDYGFGYGPRGYDGGYWNHGVLYYNAAVNRVPPGVHLSHVYHHPMAAGGPPTRVSFNGGSGGVHLQPTPAQRNAGHEAHVMPIAAQRELIQSASHDRALRADVNHGHPGIAATQRPTGRGPNFEERPDSGRAPNAERGPTPEQPRAGARGGEAGGGRAPASEHAAPHESAPAAAHAAPHAAAHPAAPRGGGKPSSKHDEQRAPPR